MILCIDTITRHAGVTLVSGDRALSHRALPVFQASDGILGAIDEVLRDAGAKLADLTAVLAITGPGSFTGLRVGIAVANALAHQLGIPIVGLRTDEWYACATDEKDYFYLQSMNREEVYAVGQGRFAGAFAEPIVKFTSLSGEAAWLGELSEAYRSALPAGFQELSGLRDAGSTWTRAAEKFAVIGPSKKYDLLEPYYGKNPSITKRKTA